MNDLYSFNKEVDDEFWGNAVHQIQIETHCLSAKAMRMVHRMVQREKELFARNCESISKDYKVSPTKVPRFKIQDKKNLKFKIRLETRRILNFKRISN